MKTKNLNVRISSILVLLVLSFGNSALKAQLNYPVKNNPACDVLIIYEIADNSPSLCEWGSVWVPAGGSVLLGNGGSCGSSYFDVHIIIDQIGSYSVPGTLSVGDPNTFITSMGTFQSGTVPPGNPCSGSWSMTWSPTVTLIN